MRGIAIMAIMLHNYCHWLNGTVRENEYKFHADRAAGMWQALTSPDDLFLANMLSFFGHYGVPVFLFLSGFVSNPMQYAEASKISLYSVADYTWNMQAYDADASWERALREVLPSAASALRTFATYNEDLGPNGHGFRRDESREIADICTRAAEGDADAVRALDAQSSLLATAAAGSDIIITAAAIDLKNLISRN